MGNQQSRSSIVQDVVNKSVSNVLMSSSSSCSQNNSMSQDLNISDIIVHGGSLEVSGISQTGQQIPNFTCSSDSANSSSLANQFKTQLDQQATSALSGLGGAANSESNSSVVGNLKNEIEQNINISNVSKCVQDNLAKQKTNIGKFEINVPGYCATGCPPGYSCDMDACTVKVKDISQSLTQSAVGQCMASNQNLQQAINSASNQIKTSSVAENKGIDVAGMFNSLVSAVTGPMKYFVIGIIVVIILVILVGGYFLMSPAGQEISTNIVRYGGKSLKKLSKMK